MIEEFATVGVEPEVLVGGGGEGGIGVGSALDEDGDLGVGFVEEERYRSPGTVPFGAGEEGPEGGWGVDDVLWERRRCGGVGMDPGGCVALGGAGCVAELAGEVDVEAEIFAGDVVGVEVVAVAFWSLAVGFLLAVDVGEDAVFVDGLLGFEGGFGEVDGVSVYVSHVGKLSYEEVVADVYGSVVWCLGSDAA